MCACPHCGYANPDSLTTCINCKQSLIIHSNRPEFRQGRACPNCSYRNADELETCLRCGYWFVEPDDEPQPPDVLELEAPLQLPDARAQSTRRKRRQYLLGLGLGLIPLIVFLVGFGLTFHIFTHASASAINTGVTLQNVSFPLYFAGLLATIACLIIREFRSAAYGLLTAVLLSPVVAAISYIIIGFFIFLALRGAKF